MVASADVFSYVPSSKNRNLRYSSGKQCKYHRRAWAAPSHLADAAALANSATPT